MTCVLITHIGYKWVCKEESQEDDDRDILEEETALEVIAKYISSFRTLSIAFYSNFIQIFHKGLYFICYRLEGLWLYLYLPEKVMPGKGALHCSVGFKTLKFINSIVQYCSA